MRKFIFGLVAAAGLMTGFAHAQPNPDLIYYRHPWSMQGTVAPYATGLVSLTTDKGTVIMARPLLHWVVRPRRSDIPVVQGQQVLMRFPRKEKFRVMSRANDTVVLSSYKGIMIVPAALLPPDDHDPSIDYDEWDSDVYDSDGSPIEN